MNSKGVILYPIGIVKSPSGRSSDCFRKNFAEIELYEQFSAALIGIERYEYLWVLYWMHKLSSDARQTLQTYPMGDITREKRGVFSLRSPMRPNPIGLTKVKLINRKGNILVVEGLDAIAETPILDIKPCMTGIDHAP